MYSNAKFGRFKSNCMTEGKWPRGTPSWVEVIYVIPLYGVSRGLNLNLHSVGGCSLKLTDYYRAEARRYLQDRAKTEAETMRQSRGSKAETEARPCKAEARPSQLKKLPRGRLELMQMPRGLHSCSYGPLRACTTTSLDYSYGF